MIISVLLRVICIQAVKWRLIACSGTVTECRLIILNNSCSLSSLMFFCADKCGTVWISVELCG